MLYELKTIRVRYLNSDFIKFILKQYNEAILSPSSDDEVAIFSGC